MRKLSIYYKLTGYIEHPSTLLSRFHSKTIPHSWTRHPSPLSHPQVFVPAMFLPLPSISFSTFTSLSPTSTVISKKMLSLPPLKKKNIQKIRWPFSTSYHSSLKRNSLECFIPRHLETFSSPLSLCSNGISITITLFKFTTYPSQFPNLILLFPQHWQIYHTT